MGHVDQHAICRFVYTGPRVGPDTFLRNFRGTIVADAFTGHKHVDQKTVISSAARHTLDVSAYLLDVLPKLAARALHPPSSRLRPAFVAACCVACTTPADDS